VRRAGVVSRASERRPLAQSLFKVLLQSVNAGHVVASRTSLPRASLIGQSAPASPNDLSTRNCEALAHVHRKGTRPRKPTLPAMDVPEKFSHAYQNADRNDKEHGVRSLLPHDGVRQSPYSGLVDLHVSARQASH